MICSFCLTQPGHLVSLKVRSGLNDGTHDSMWTHAKNSFTRTQPIVEGASAARPFFVFWGFKTFPPLRCAVVLFSLGPPFPRPPLCRDCSLHLLQQPKAALCFKSSRTYCHAAAVFPSKLRADFDFFLDDIQLDIFLLNSAAEAHDFVVPSLSFLNS